MTMIGLPLAFLAFLVAAAGVGASTNLRPADPPHFIYLPLVAKAPVGSQFIEVARQTIWRWPVSLIPAP
jgi:hypothetical protein